MRKSPNQRRKAPSKQSGNTQQDPTNNRVPAQGFMKSKRLGEKGPSLSYCQAKEERKPSP